MRIENIPLHLIDEDKDQPRNTFTESTIDELAESIKEIGLLNPIKVRKINDNRYKIIFGNRRYKAFVKLNYEAIPCIISESSDELEIYIEQITENLQRENISPIEEALAFQKLLNDQRWKISKKYLSGKLGKSERYISKKLDLLLFGSDVRKIIHGGNDVIKGALSEEQALRLKKVPIEYRDQLAIKVAQEQLIPDDIERISTLFTDRSRSLTAKEKLLSLKGNDLLSIWFEYEGSKNYDNQFENNSRELSLVNKKQIISHDDEKIIEDYLLRVAPLQEKINQLISRIPTFHSISPDLFDSINEMTLEQRQELLITLNILISNTEAHLEEWRILRIEAERKLKPKDSIKLIKP
ncbi:ParB/RepB/Spo0J family partition protein [Heliobacterium chlorum]|uniref:ParB/RepB/Spo0J family partition protein n=1 Tax=Heliobacterium chlorum TaxID=2698 RepID=A0ABR7T592_HELCL|nr:ParB/RepB/Spo0J family partition protein [Heliobacterium chlorum]MBC9785945.1 ParB/RepB/Spo0J family partition protein [Heliobacterium chlorum]